jgi:hypothetical protein
MNCGIGQHYKFGKPGSNYVLKFLFNSWAKKILG